MRIPADGGPGSSAMLSWALATMDWVDDLSVCVRVCLYADMVIDGG